MQFITGPLNDRFLSDALGQMTPDCIRVRAAIAYASRDNMRLFEACERESKSIEFYGRYDQTVPIHPDIFNWFLDKRSPNFQCRLVPDILHAKVMWWVDVGAYIGSANLTNRAWLSNVEAGCLLSQDELLDAGMERELELFFQELAELSQPLTRAIAEEQRRLRSALDELESDFEAKVGPGRLIARHKGLAHHPSNGQSDKRFAKFEKEWESTLQIMKDIAHRVSAKEVRPSWIEEDVPPGVQADQFLHAFYYKSVRSGNRHPYEEFFEANRRDPESALRRAIEAWQAAAFDFSYESRTIHEWSPLLRSYLSKERLLGLSRDEFVQAMSMIHAIRDHAVKQENEHLGLSAVPHQAEQKIKSFGEWLWAQESADRRSTVETIHFVIWGESTVTSRLWRATTDAEWKIHHLGLSSLGKSLAGPSPMPFRLGIKEQARRSVHSAMTLS